jgi:glycerol kinase
MPLGLVVGSGTATVELENPEPGRVEIDPDSLWEKVTKVCTPRGSLLDQHSVVKLQIFLCKCQFLFIDLVLSQCCTDKLCRVSFVQHIQNIKRFFLWQVLKDCLKAGGVTASSVAALGISCQRATFTTWSRTTGR